MARAIAGVVLGYVVMVAFSFAALTLVYLGLGADGTFRGDTFDVTPTWLGAMLLIDVAAGVAGGFVCLLLARKRTPVWFLAGIVLVLGTLVAVPHFLPPREGVPVKREGEVGVMQASEYARQPGWAAVLHPVLGVAGLVGVSRWRKPTS